MTTADNTQPAMLWVNTDEKTLSADLHNTSLLLFLREHCLSTGTKEGCGSGDCGACTVILRDPETGDVQSVNSCITPVFAASGKQVVTVEGVGTMSMPHPVQAAMVAEHGSQCGFCTPGFVMSMVAEQLTAPSLTNRERENDVRAISGNLCRCTGYKPILSAARKANDAVGSSSRKPEQWLPAIQNWQTPTDAQESAQANNAYRMPRTERELQAQLAQGRYRNTNPLIAGATDLWLLVSQDYVDFDSFIDLTRVASLRQIERTDSELIIGAAVSHAELLGFFTGDDTPCAAIAEILQRFGSPQIRNRGTIGGNLAGGSPIADWPPLLMALDAWLTLSNAAGESRQIGVSEFFKGYRSTELDSDEYIARIHLPACGDAAYSRLDAYKISKREEDDISSVLGAFDIRLGQNGVSRCRIALGGVAATPIRLTSLEQNLMGKRLTDNEITEACEVLAGAIEPLTDVRASTEYRRAMSASLLRRALMEARGTPPARLSDVT